MGDVTSRRTRSGLSSILAKAAPSVVSLLRAVLAIYVARHTTAQNAHVAALFLVPLIFSLDAVDGVIARKLGSVSTFGSFIDIAGDRVVEFAFFYSFASIGLLPAWFVFVFYGRAMAADGARLLAFRAGRGRPDGVVVRPQLRPLLHSHISRAGYAVTKCLLISALYFEVRQSDPEVSALAVEVLLLSTVVFSLVRLAPLLPEYASILADVLTPRNQRPILQTPAPSSGRAREYASWSTSLQLGADMIAAVVLVIRIGWLR